MREKILVVGQMKYGNHDVNIIQPILHVLSERFGIVRVGSTMDFFLPENYCFQVDRWLENMPLDFTPYSFVLVTDFWFPALPVYIYQSSVSKPVPFVSIFHGASWMDGDFAQNYPYATELEEYLVQVYKRVIVASPWVLQKMPRNIRRHRSTFQACRFPMDAQLFNNRPRVQRNARKVIFNARWEADKAPERFVRFAEFCQHTGIEFISFNNVKDDLARNAEQKGLVRFTGYPLSKDELANELRNGGYAWNHSRQEMTGYGVLEMVAKGLTPLVFRDKQMVQGLGFPKQFYFRDYADALLKIEDGLLMDDADWKEYVMKNRNNASEIARAIMNVLE